MNNDVLRNEAQILILEARLKALESIVFGFLRSLSDDYEPDWINGNQRLFYEFFVEHVFALKKQLPAAVANCPDVQDLLETQIRNAQHCIEKLDEQAPRPFEDLI